MYACVCVITTTERKRKRKGEERIQEREGSGEEVRAGRCFLHQLMGSLARMMKGQCISYLIVIYVKIHLRQLLASPQIDKSGESYMEIKFFSCFYRNCESLIKLYFSFIYF